MERKEEAGEDKEGKEEIKEEEGRGRSTGKEKERREGPDCGEGKK